MTREWCVGEKGTSENKWGDVWTEVQMQWSKPWSAWVRNIPESRRYKGPEVGSWLGFTMSREEARASGSKQSGWGRKREGHSDRAGPQHLGFCGLQNTLSLGLGKPEGPLLFEGQSPPVMILASSSLSRLMDKAESSPNLHLFFLVFLVFPVSKNLHTCPSV